MSNLIPLLFCAPFPVIASYFDRRGQTSLALGFWIATPAALWLGINFFALYQNQRIRSALLPKLRAMHPEEASHAVFVGFARPKSNTAVHLHEDVGWLLMLNTHLVFLGESLTFSIPKEHIRSIRFGFNWNSLLGLGRWIIIEGVEEGKRVQMRIEPREKRTLLGNRSYGKALSKRLNVWRGSSR